jgi:hypothetical protein
MKHIMGVDLYLQTFLTSPFMEVKGLEVPSALIPRFEALAPTGLDPKPVWTFRSF